jgi:hypothetical protein
MDKNSKKIQELEKRVAELEKKQKEYYIPQVIPQCPIYPQYPIVTYTLTSYSRNK